MAEHLHDDRFDEFMKNSLDQYSESPPDSVWEGIEESFPVGGIPFWGRYWWAAAVVVLLAGAFVYQHTYYRQKLDKLEMQLKIEKERAVASSDSGGAPVNPLTKPSENAGNTDQSLESTIANAPNRSTAHPSEEMLPEKVTGDKRRATEQHNAAPPTDLSGVKNDKAVESPGNLVAERHPLNTTGNEKKSEKAVASPSPVAIEPLDIFLKYGEASINLELPPQQLPSREFWAGPAVGMFSSHRKFSGTSGTHHHGGGPHPHFEAQTTTSGQSVSAGLRVERELTGGISLCSGVFYNESEFSSTHTPSFKLGESMPGMHGFEHDFQYSLYTPSGSATLNLRVEQVDTSVQVSPDENIGLTVGTSQKFRYVSIPLGIAWRTHKGRLGFGLSAGFIGNFLLDSGMSVSNIEVQNPMFQVHHEGNSSFASVNTTAPFYLELEAAALLNVHLRQGLRLEIGPSLRLQLTDASADPQNGSSGYAAGLQSALMYRF
ncbi:MAG: hypothetical protein CMN32_01075 [Saprospirales bacterium]|nr:hypothetical protein [Saprospirales bacterium]